MLLCWSARLTRQRSERPIAAARRAAARREVHCIFYDRRSMISLHSAMLLLFYASALSNTTDNSIRHMHKHLTIHYTHTSPTIQRTSPCRAIVFFTFRTSLVTIKVNPTNSHPSQAPLPPPKTTELSHTNS